MLKKISDKDIYKKIFNKNFKIQSNLFISIDPNNETKIKKIINKNILIGCDYVF